MPRYIDENDIYKLFDMRGKAMLHVGDIDVLPRATFRPTVNAEWIPTCNGKMCRCSNCETEFDNTCNLIEEDWYFCPHCEANMNT